MQNNQLTQFNEGGSHESNPLGGIPQGQASDGSMNTVEQGESKKGNFVYSDRIPLNEDIAKQFNLPTYTKNKTIAEASKAIDKKFKDRNDKPSLETKNTLLDRLAQAQESIKQHQQMVNQAIQANSQQVPDQMNGQIPQGMEEYTEPQNNPQEEQMEVNPNAAYGGYQNKMFLGGMFGQSELSNLTGGGQGIAGASGPGANANKYLGTAMGAMSLGNLANGVGASPNQNATALSGAMQGAQTGLMFGPLGAGIGAAVGLGAGILGGNKAQAEQAAFAKKQAISYNKGVSGDYAYGGKMYSNGGPFPIGDTVNNVYNKFAGEGTLNNDTLTQSLAGQFIKPLQAIDGTGLKRGLNTIPNKSVISANIPIKNTNTTIPTDTNKINYGQLANQAMRMSPILSNFSQLNGMTRPNPVAYTPMRNTYQYDPIDEARQERMISQEGNRQLSAIGQSGASQGALRNAITSIGLNTMKARSAAAMDTESQNRAQRLGFQQSQLGVNQYNNQLVNKAIDETRMDQGAYDTQRSKFIGAIGTELGQVGKERVYADKASQMFGYDENGKYLLGPDGNKVRVPDTNSTLLTPQQKAYLATMPKAFGGYLTNKKKK